MRLKAHRFTEEQDRYIRDNHEMKTAKDFAEEFNQKFNTEINADQIRNFRGRHKLISGLTGHFEKKHKPFNKGMKQTEFMSKEAIERTKGTRFKKGQQPGNYLPIGSTRICSKDGYILVKVKDTGRRQDMWRHKHRLVWEREYGKIKSGFILTFKNGDKLDCSLDNLLLITRRENALINRVGLRDEDYELNEVGINVGRLISKASEVDKK